MSIYFKEFEKIIKKWCNIYYIKKPVNCPASSVSYKYMQRAAKKQLLSDILDLFKSLDYTIQIVPDGCDITITSKL
jgi:hypothetical protein